MTCTIGYTPLTDTDNDGSKSAASTRPNSLETPGEKIPLILISPDARSYFEIVNHDTTGAKKSLAYCSRVSGSELEKVLKRSVLLEPFKKFTLYMLDHKKAYASILSEISSNPEKLKADLDRGPFSYASTIVKIREVIEKHSNSIINPLHIESVHETMAVAIEVFEKINDTNLLRTAYKTAHPKGQTCLPLLFENGRYFNLRTI